MFMVPSRCLLLGLAALLSMSAVARSQETDQQPELKLELHDISSLVEVRRPPQPRSWSPPLQRPLQRPGSSMHTNPQPSPLTRDYQREAARFLEPDELVDLIQRLLPGQPFDEEGTSIGTINESVLFVRNTPAVLGEVERLLEGLRRIEARRIRLHVDILVMSGSAVRSLIDRPRQTLDAAEREALLGSEGVRVVMTGSEIGVPGDLVHLLDREEMAFVSDFDVEVAQDSRVADSIISVLETGPEITARASVRLSGDGIQLEYTVDDVGRRLSWQDTDTAENVGRVALPSVSFTQAAGSVIVPSGHTALLWAGGTTDGVAFLVRPEIVEPPGSATAGEAGGEPGSEPAGLGSGELRLGVFPLHSLLTARTRARLPKELGGGEALSGSRPPFGFDVLEEDPRWRLDIHTIIDLVRMEVQPRSWDESRRAIDFDREGEYLLVFQSPQILDSVGHFLRELESVAVPGSHSITAELWAIPPAIADEIASGTLSQDELAKIRSSGELEWAAQLPALLGSAAQVVQATESAYLQDFDPEIAQEATIADPIVGSYLTGASLVARIEPAGGEQLRLTAQSHLARSERDPHSYDLDAPFLGSVHLPRVQSSSISGSALMKPGASVMLGQRTRGNKRLVLVATVN